MRRYPGKETVITTDNVQNLGEIIAVCAAKKLYQISYSKTLHKLYHGLVQDRYCMHDVKHTLSDGYDLAQTAICFLCGYIGKTLGDDCGFRNRKSETFVDIEQACYREVAKILNRGHRAGLREVCIDEWYGLEVAAPEEKEYVEHDYTAVEEKISQMNLTKTQRDTLAYRMDGNTLASIGDRYSLTLSAICHRMRVIKKIYMKHFGDLTSSPINTQALPLQ